jgi:parvulin-like peptidyl-prolyl isomerase
LSKKKNIKKAPREMTHRQLSHHKRAQRRQRILFYGGIAIIVAVVGIILGGWLAGEYLPMNAIVLEVFETKFNTAYYIDTMVLLAQLQGSRSMSELAAQAVNQIMSSELIIQEAGKLGIVVTDEEAKQFWQNLGLNINVNSAAIHLAKSQLLSAKLKEQYFASLIPEADVQFSVRAMLVESDTIAELLRERIINGENFTLLAEQYATDAASKDVLGDYGWHTISVFKDKFYATIPLDYISRADAKAGDVSQPLSDNASSKKLGYWLIRVNERPDQDTANVSAVYLGSEEEALAIRARMEAGANLGPIADNLSQYTNSQQNHGELGSISVTDNITDVFNGYVFSPSTEIGKWSQPLRDDTFYSKGGVWLVQIVDKDENRPLSTEDRDSLISTLFTDWTSKIWTEFSPLFINHLTEDLTQWAVDRASKQL